MRAVWHKPYAQLPLKSTKTSAKQPPLLSPPATLRTAVTLTLNTARITSVSRSPPTDKNATMTQVYIAVLKAVTATPTMYALRPQTQAFVQHMINVLFRTTAIPRPLYASNAVH